MAAKKKKAARKKRASVAHDTRNHLDRLPVELLCLITEQCVLSIRDLISLALTNRRCYETAIPTVYKKHVKEEYGIAIYWAVKNEQYDTLGRLIENGVDVDLNQRKVYKEADEEATQDEPESFFDRESFFEGFENIRAYMDVDPESSFTPLAWATSLGLDSMVQYLLDRGADIEYSCTYLCDCCSMMLDSPMDFPSCPCFTDYGDYGMSFWTPLHYAICKGHESTAKLLIARGASVQVLAPETRESPTALHVATRWGQENIIDHLLDNKLVDINASGYSGVTALHIAYVAHNFALVDKYLELGADINRAFDRTPDGGWNIFAMACGEDKLDKALQYLKRGADPRFVIKSLIDRELWTAMRFIYENRDTRSAYPTVAEVHERVTLEREIINVICGKPPASNEN